MEIVRKIVREKIEKIDLSQQRQKTGAERTWKMQKWKFFLHVLRKN